MRTLLKPLDRIELQKLYSQPHRYYHTLEHVAILFQLASAHGIRLSVPQQLAVWYHDAIYNPERNDNEEKSCHLMLKRHEDTVRLNQGYLNRAACIIMDTKTHISDDYESQTVIDLDLAGFGFDSETYDYTTHLIRAEYRHLSDDEWRLGRIAFLNNILKRDNIYYTNWARDFYERQAIRNIQRELDLL